MHPFWKSPICYGKRERDVRRHFKSRDSHAQHCISLQLAQPSVVCQGSLVSLLTSVERWQETFCSVHAQQGTFPEALQLPADAPAAKFSLERIREWQRTKDWIELHSIAILASGRDCLRPFRMSCVSCLTPHACFFGGTTEGRWSPTNVIKMLLFGRPVPTSCSPDAFDYISH